jgi:hypothetical protein
VNDKQLRDFLKAMKEMSKKTLRSKKTARTFLVKSGVSTPDGKLTKMYR